MKLGQKDTVSSLKSRLSILKSSNLKSSQLELAFSSLITLILAAMTAGSDLKITKQEEGEATASM